MNTPYQRIGICTDSTAQLPAALIERFDIEVVPVTVTIDDHDFLEGVDLDADRFYELFRDGHQPTVTTSQPSPGQFALAYEALASRGCTGIVSIHVTAAASGTVNAARLGARMSPVPVKLIDSGTASFGVGCCAWAAALAAEQGLALCEVASVAQSLAPDIKNVFIVGALDLMRRGGRVEADFGESVVAVGEIPVLSMIDGSVQTVARAGCVDSAVRAMADELAAMSRAYARVNVAVGVADAAGAALSSALAELIRNWPNLNEVVEYRVGPSIGAHTGPGTAGAFVYPVVDVASAAAV